MKDIDYIADLFLCAFIICLVITLPALAVWLSQ